MFQPFLLRALGGPQLIAGLPELKSVAGLPISEAMHARLSFLDAPAEPIVLLGLDSKGGDVLYVLADSAAVPQQLRVVKGFSERLQGEVLHAELTLPASGETPGIALELLIGHERTDVLHRNLELRMGEAVIAGKRYALAYVRDPRFATYSLPDESHGGFTLYQLMIDLDGDGLFLTYPGDGVIQDEVFEVTKPFSLDGQAYKVAHVSATGDSMVIESSVEEFALAVGFQMPNLSVERLDQSVVELSALRGTPIVLNWWSTFCAPCVAEIPELNQLVEKHAASGVEFLAIADNETAELVAFLENKTFAYDVARGGEDAVRLFGQGYPRHVIIDSDGTVRYDVHGYSSDSADNIDAIIGTLLSEL